MNKILNSLFAEGGLLRVRAVLSIIIIAALSVMYLSQIPVPEEFVGLGAVVVAFYHMSRKDK